MPRRFLAIDPLILMFTFDCLMYLIRSCRFEDRWLRRWVYLLNYCSLRRFVRHLISRHANMARYPVELHGVDRYDERDRVDFVDLDIRYRRGKKAIVPDALSRRPDYLDYLTAIGINIRYDDYIPHLKEYLISKILPQDPAMRERIKALANEFTLDVDQTLLRKLKNGSTAPYIEPLFRGDLL